MSAETAAVPAAASPEHEHRYSILIGHAPITMCAGFRLPSFRECRCGERIAAGTVECGGI